MTHALVEQHFEVGPLHGTRVLKLVDHDMFEYCSYLFEYERRVGVLYQ